MRRRTSKERLLAKSLESRMKKNLPRIIKHVEVYEERKRKGNLTDSPEPSPQFND